MSVLSKPIRADHLLSIFTRAPITTLLRLPLVCTAWSSLQPSACRQTHTLSLCLVRENDVRESRITQSPFNRLSPSLTPNLSLTHRLSLSSLTFSLPYALLPRALTTSLLTLFPFIRALSLESRSFAFPFQTSIPPLVSLLRGWAHSLTSLGLYGFEYVTSEQLPSSLLRHLLSAINTLHALKHLTIDVDNYFLPRKCYQETGAPTYPQSIRFSALSRLQSFSLNCLDNYLCLLPSLRAYAYCNPDLPEIHLGTSHSNALISSLAEEGSPLLSRICTYSYCDLQISTEATFIGVHLRHLSTLSLTLHKSDGQTLCALAQTLRNCTKLRTLALSFLNLESVQLGVSQHSELPELPSVTSLFFQPITLSSHTVLAERLPLGRLFPNLETFQLDNYGTMSCTVCDFNYKNHFVYPQSPLTGEQRLVQRRCAHLMVREALTGCDKLKKIVIQNWKDQIKVYEELPVEIL